MAAAGGKPGVATAVNSGYGSQIEGKKATYWKKNSSRVPGSIKPVYSSKNPMDVVLQQPQGRGSPSKSGKHKKDSFADFDSSTCDAWEVNDDEFLSMTSRKLSIETPGIEGQVDPTRVQRSNVHLQRSSGSKDSVKATIKDTHIQQGDVPLQDKNTEPHSPGRPQRIDTSSPPSSPTSPTLPSPDFSGQAGQVPGTMEAPRPSSPIRLPTMPVQDRQDGKLTKFEKVLTASNMEMEVLRKLSWAGIPKTVRPTAWKVLSGYLPANIERRQATLDRKREEYFGFVDQYYETRHDAQHKNMFHQIHIDIPRTNPLIPLFQESNVQEIFERILYIWALKHPASGYVQGINDLVTPFFVVFLSEHVGGEDIEHIEKYKGIKKLPQETLREIEADSFWCMSKLLDGIQDNYTFAQPGIQLKVAQLKELIQRINAPLHRHLMENQLDYLQFAFRWMNNILMREFPLSCTVRLWDTYMSEPEGFAVFHLYVCAALLQMFAGKIMREKDFQGTMLFLQNLPTHNWGNKDISLLVAEAYKLKYMFADAPRHLNQQAKR